MNIRFTISDEGKTIADVTVTDDGKVQLTTTGQPVVDATKATDHGAAQYVWGATNISERASRVSSITIERQATSGTNLDELQPGERRAGKGMNPES